MGELKPVIKTTTEGSRFITLSAIAENFAVAQDQVHEFLESVPCSMRTLLELDMVVEEIFINIANYAYSDGIGTVTLVLSFSENKDTLYMTFRDSGVPYDPLKKESPNLSAPAAERPIGGLGIFLVQEYSDSLSYEYANGENRLTIVKKLA